MHLNKTPQAIIASEYNIREKICGVAIGVIAIVFSLAIMHGDSTLIDPSKRFLVAIPNYLALLVLSFEVFSSPKEFKLFIPLFIVWIFQWLLDNFHLAPGVESSVQWPTLILIFLFCMMKPRVWHYGFRVYRIFLVVTSLFGIVAFGAFLTGVIQPLDTVEYYNNSGGQNAMYIVYPLSYLVVGSTDGIEAIRLSGLFNEPGYFGTILALALIADGLDIRNIGSWIMLITGTFTLSFAFFVLIAMYWGFRAMKNAKTLLKIAALSALCLFLILPLIPEDSSVGWLVQRFSYDKDENKVAGDDRTTSAFEMYWDQTVANGQIIFGQGGGFFNNKDVGSLSCKKVIVEHGFVFSFMMWGLLFFACMHFKQRKMAWWILLICFFASVYQRPSIFLYSYMLILFGGMKNIETMELGKSIIIPQKLKSKYKV